MLNIQDAEMTPQDAFKLGQDTAKVASSWWDSKVSYAVLTIPKQNHKELYQHFCAGYAKLGD